ncbi:MAG: homocysteine S-methyltransferase family protein [Oscillospiraceae bacterium]|jgi:5-methyltetrahydrofolate--homocysteine methyltransferase|nr:homocysteine S-methyltransferase family protein [Oscillospiraceae bacterium]
MIFDEFGNYIFYDGAMGTMLQQRGLKPGERPDLMNISNPEAVESVHRLYVEAGSDIICTNTFISTNLNLKGAGSPEQVVSAAVEIAKRATKGYKTKVSLDIGPTGELLEPVGDLEPEQAYEIFKEIVIIGEKCGVDFASIETMSDIEELRVAILAIKENTKLPILATMTFEKSGYTFMGVTPEVFVEVAESLGVAALGLNCSLEPEQMYDIAKRIADATKLPLIIKPNAGLPDSLSGEYKTGAEQFAAQMLPFKDIGARIVGGCCGTTPEYIKALKAAYGD